MSPRANRRTQLPDEVASYVRELIVTGKVQPGQFIRMEPIAEAVGVSNTPVREGLLTLRSEGFVELVPRRGFVVAEFTRQDVHDLFWAQAQLAGELAARAAKNADAGLVGRLEKMLDEESESASQEDITEAGHNFHREINLAAKSRRLALLLGNMVGQLPLTFYADLEGEGVTGDDHRELIKLFKASDVRKVRSFMEQHIMNRASRLTARLEESGFWAQPDRT